MNPTEDSENKPQHRYYAEYAALVGQHPQLEESDEESSLHLTATGSFVSYHSRARSSLTNVHFPSLNFDTESTSIPVNLAPGQSQEHNSGVWKSDSIKGHHRRHTSAPKSLYHRFCNLPNPLTLCLRHKTCPPQTQLTDSQSGCPIVAASDLGASEDSRALVFNRSFPAEAYRGLCDNKRDDWTNDISTQQIKHRRYQSAPVIIHDNKIHRRTVDSNSVIRLPDHGISYSRPSANTRYLSAFETNLHGYDPAEPLPVRPRWPFLESNCQEFTNDERSHAFPTSSLLDSGQAITNYYSQREDDIGLSDALDDEISNLRIGFVEGVKSVRESTVHGIRRASISASLCSNDS